MSNIPDTIEIITKEQLASAAIVIVRGLSPQSTSELLSGIRSFVADGTILVALENEEDGNAEPLSMKDIFTILANDGG